jgi:hypothetical protein
LRAFGRTPAGKEQGKADVKDYNNMIAVSPLFFMKSEPLPRNLGNYAMKAVFLIL